MIFWNSAGFARPVRTFAKSSLAASRDFCIFSRASASTSEITGAPSGLCYRFVVYWGAGALVGDERADPIAAQRRGDIALRLHAEDHHRHLVVHAEAERSGVDHLEPFDECLLVGDLL